MKALGLGILGSGRGSNCRAILEAIRAGTLPARACVVVSDVLDAPILDIAREFSVPNAYLPPGQFRTRLEPAVEADLVRMLRDAGVDLVILAGFMRVLKAPMLEAFPRLHSLDLFRLKNGEAALLGVKFDGRRRDGLLTTYGPVGLRKNGTHLMLSFNQLPQ